MIHRLASLCASLAWLLATGCSSDSQAVPSGQVVARVGGIDLTVHQLNQFLSGRKLASADSSTRAQALTALIEQQMFAQRAKQDGLDRDPAVLAAIQSSTSRILAQAQADRIRMRVPPPNASEIEAFYDSHPALFRGRRIYTVEELSIPSPLSDLPELIRRAEKSRRLEDITAWLQVSGVQSARQHGMVRPEDISLEHADRLHAAQVGQLVVLSPPTGGAQVMHLTKIEHRPISRTDAAPWIERRLLEARQREVMNREISAMKEATKIERLGEFAHASIEASPVVPSNRSISSVDRGVGALK